MMNKVDWTKQSGCKMENSRVTIVWESPNQSLILLNAASRDRRLGLKRFQIAAP